MVTNKRSVPTRSTPSLRPAVDNLIRNSLNSNRPFLSGFIRGGNELTTWRTPHSNITHMYRQTQLLSRAPKMFHAKNVKKY